MLTRIRSFTRRVHRGLRRRWDRRGLSEGDVALIDKVRAENLTYLSEAKLTSIVRTCKAIRDAGRPGIFVEAGCALGGSTIVLASVKSEDRVLAVYDVFGLIPAPTDDDTPDVHARYQTITEGKSRGIGGDVYYGYVDNLYDVVVHNLRRFGLEPADNQVRLVKGLLQETMHIEAPVAFAHIDVDWYEPVLTCLQRIHPHLVEGGAIILDDYHDWGGCRKATDQFLASVPGCYAADDSAGSLRLTRLGA